MAIRFASLGSGSDGNALVVEARSGASVTRVLLDCGFSQKDVERRLGRLGLSAGQLDAILITHEHGDHIGSGLGLARRLRVPIHMSWGTARAVGAVSQTDLDWRPCTSGIPIVQGDLQILPYTVPHDAREPLQFTFSDGASRLGVLTDIGIGTPLVTQILAACDALVLECNHDSEMLAQSRYPTSLKTRIAGALGHLSNAAAAAILAGLDRSHLRHLVGAHLSRQNNTASLARESLARALGATAAEILIATQEEGFGWLQG